MSPGARSAGVTFVITILASAAAFAGATPTAMTRARAASRSMICFMMLSYLNLCAYILNSCFLIVLLQKPTDSCVSTKHLNTPGFTF
jgi:hypothetical protein